MHVAISAWRCRFIRCCGATLKRRRHQAIRSGEDAAEDADIRDASAAHDALCARAAPRPVRHPLPLATVLILLIKRPRFSAAIRECEDYPLLVHATIRRSARRETVQREAPSAIVVY